MKTAFASFMLVIALALPSLGAEKATLAVLDFTSRDIPREDAVKISLLIRNELSNLAEYRTLDREQTVKALGGDAACDDVSCAVEAGKKLGAHAVIVGSIMKFGDNLTVTGRVIDTGTGAVLMAEKERAVFQADEYYMVERFCDRIARRMTGKALYREVRPAPEERATEMTVSPLAYRAPDYHPAADPTAWLALGAGIASGMGFLEAAASFNLKKSAYRGDKWFCLSLWSMGMSPSFSDPTMALAGALGMINIRNDLAHARRLRDTEYYVAAGIGGFSALMLTTFIGRNIAAAARAGKTAKKIPVTLELSSRFNDAAPEDYRRRFGMGVGLAMRF